MIKADLHTHSYYSDGKISPAELVNRAKKAGLDVLALTDHTSVKGVDEAVRLGKKLGVRVIPAVEITGSEGEILTYFIDTKDKKLIKFLRQCAESQQRVVKHMISDLKNQGLKLSFSELQKTFPHAMHNHNRGHLLQYARIKGVSSDSLRRHKKFSQYYDEIPILKIVGTARKLGYVPVLAHPWFSKEVLFDQKVMKKLVDAGLMGLEFDNGDRNRWGRDDKTRKIMLYYAKKYKLILTKGTDHHASSFMKGFGHHLGKTYCSERTVKQIEKAKNNLKK